MNKSSAIVLCLAFAARRRAVAAPLNRNIVSGKANCRAPGPGETQPDRDRQDDSCPTGETGDAAKLDQFKTIASFHPLDDIRNVTIYGRGKDKANAVAIFEAAFNKDTLLGLLRLNAAFSETAYGVMIEAGSMTSTTATNRCASTAASTATTASSSPAS